MSSASHHPPPSSRRSWRLILLLCGCCLGTGVQWDALQAAAWIRMWLANVQNESPSDALARTFSPEGMCRVCHAVQAVKQVQRDDERVLISATEKAPLLPASLSCTILCVPASGTTLADGDMIEPAAVFREPLLPPPRKARV